MAILRNLWSVLSLVTLSTLILAAPHGVPQPEVPLPFGANIHFTQAPEQELNLLAEGGFSVVRMDLFWHDVEKQKGVYDFSQYDVLVRDMTERGIRLLFILDYGNSLYDDGAAPRTEEGRAAFARFAAAAAKRYAGKGILWEIWNEPNIYPFWRPKPDVEDYAKLALAVIDAVRKADRKAFIVAPASSGFPWDFLETLGQRGVLQKLDAVTVHPYRQQNPETVQADYRRLRLLLDHYSPNKYLPILSGEWGYSDIWQNMDMQKQARYLVRQWLTNLANDVFLSIWYDWKNDGEDPKEPEHHFGTVYHNLKLKPAYVAAKTLTSTLRGYRYLRRIDMPNPNDYLLLFQKGRELALAAWTTDSPHPITLRLPSMRVVLVDMMGKRRAVDVGRDPLVLNLSEDPQYLLLPPHEELEFVGTWAPEYQVSTVRAGASQVLRIVVHNVARIPMNGKLRLKVGDQVVGETRVSVRGGERSVALLPVRVTERGANSMRATVELIANQKAEVLQTATVWLCVANSLSVQVLPPVQRQVMVVVHNPSGEAFQGSLQIKSGQQQAVATLDLTKGQREAIATVRMPVELPGTVPLSLEILDSSGTAVARYEPVIWTPTGSFDKADGWRAWVDGDAKVSATVQVTLAEAPEPTPTGLRTAIRMDYRFAPGWRFACVNLPQPHVSIEGKPKAVGMWVYGDGSGNMLRCRITDSTGQTFQPDYGHITWKGWRFVTMRLDGGFPGFWGGAKDGVVHYPIRWEAVVLVDSNQQSADKDWSIYIAGIALQY